MIRCSPTVSLKLPSAHEASKLKPLRDSDSPLMAWKRIEVLSKQLAASNQTVEQLSRDLVKVRRRVIGGASTNSSWHKPNNRLYEVDPTYTYDEGSVIHIQPANSLVTTGIRDAFNLIAHPDGSVGDLITSCAGYWVATQDVPAKVTVAGKDFWNLPQSPMPVPTNIDDSKNYWIYLGEMDC